MILRKDGRRRQGSGTSTQIEFHSSSIANLLSLLLDTLGGILASDLVLCCSHLVVGALLHVIVEKVERSDMPNIDKKKYLVPADLTVGQFVYVIRKRVKLSAEKAIFIFVDNVLPPTGSVMSTIYDEKKDEDGFLYVTYSGENTFGGSEIEF